MKAKISVPLPKSMTLFAKLRHTHNIICCLFGFAILVSLALPGPLWSTGLEELHRAHEHHSTHHFQHDDHSQFHVEQKNSAQNLSAQWNEPDPNCAKCDFLGQLVRTVSQQGFGNPPKQIAKFSNSSKGAALCSVMAQMLPARSPLCERPGSPIQGPPNLRNA